MSYVNARECKLYLEVRKLNIPECGLFASDLTSASKRNVFQTL